jgi:hypothetical protein
MSTVVFRPGCLCLLILIPIVEGCSREEEEGEDFVVVEGLFQGLIEVEESYHEVGTVEGLLLLLKLCREGDRVLDWCLHDRVSYSRCQTVAENPSMQSKRYVTRGYRGTGDNPDKGSEIQPEGILTEKNVGQRATHCCRCFWEKRPGGLFGPKQGP